MDDRRRPVAQRDHLALAARLEPRRHEEEVGAGVDPPGHHAVEALDERDLVRARRGEPSERVRELRVAAALDDDPGAAPRAAPARRDGHEVEALLRIEPPDHPEHQPVVVRIEAEPGQQVRPAGGLAREVGPRVGRGDVGVGRRIPDRGVEAVEDPDEPVALRPQQSPSRPIPKAGVSASAANPGETVLTSSARSMPIAQQVDPVGRRRRRSRRRAAARAGARRRPRRPAVIGEVVERHEDRRLADDRVVGVALVAEDAPPGRCASRGDAGRRPGGRRRAAPRAPPGRTARTARRCRRSRRPRRRRSPPGRRRRVVDEAQPIAVGGDVDDRDLAGARRARAGPARARSSPRDGRPAGPGRCDSAAGRRRPGPAMSSADEPCRARAPARRRRRPGRRSWPTARTRRRGTRSRSGIAGILAVRALAAVAPGRRGTDRDRSGREGRPGIIPARWTPSASRRSRRRRSRCRPGSKACGASPTTSTGRGTRGPAACGASSTGPAWTRYRNPIPVISGPTDWSRLLDDAEVPGRVPRRPRRVRPLHGQRLGPLVPAALRATRSTGPIAYFCAEYGLHESLGIYSGGLGVLAGDHMKSASDMALPRIGVGLLYRKGYFRQTIDADGHQEHDYPDYDLSPPAAQPRPGPERAAADGLRRAARAGTLAVAVWLAQVGPGAGPAARHGRAGERRAGPADHPHPVRPRPRDAAPPGARPRRRRRPGDPGARPRARRSGTSTRATPRSCSPSAPASSWPPATDARRRLGDGPARQRVHDPHAGLGRQRALRRRPRPARRRPAARRRRRADRQGPRARASARTTTARPVRHDRLLAAPDERRQRREPAPRARPPTRRGTASRTTRSWASPTASTARPGSAPRSRTCSSATSTPTSTTSTRPPSRAASGSASSASRRATCGTRTCARSASSRISPRAGCAASSPATARRPSVLAELETALDPSILTIGFARRFATYKRAGLLFSDIDRLARMLWDAERPVQIVFAGKAHPADRPGQRVIQEIFQLSRSPKLRGRVFILEDYDMRVGALPRPGRRRLAQQPAPPARGVGHVRHEGGPERRPERQRPRRLVGRGLHRRQRLGDRRARDEPRRGRPGLGRRAGPLPDPRGGDRARATTTATRTASRPDWLAVMRRAMATLALAVLDDADAPRVHRAALPARRPGSPSASPVPSPR